MSMHRMASKLLLFSAGVVSFIGCAIPGGASATWPTEVFTGIASTLGWASFSWLMGLITPPAG